MCFKTANLPAPAENKAKRGLISPGGARYHVRVTKHSARMVRLSLGEVDGTESQDSSQYFEPAGLREFARHLNELADKLEV